TQLITLTRTSNHTEAKPSQVTTYPAPLREILSSLKAELTKGGTDVLHRATIVARLRRHDACTSTDILAALLQFQNSPKRLTSIFRQSVVSIAGEDPVSKFSSPGDSSSTLDVDWMDVPLSKGAISMLRAAALAEQEAFG